MMIFLTAILIVVAFVIGVLVGRIGKMSFGCPSMDSQSELTPDGTPATSSADNAAAAASVNLVSADSGLIVAEEQAKSSPSKASPATKAKQAASKSKTAPATVKKSKAAAKSTKVAAAKPADKVSTTATATKKAPSKAKSAATAASKTAPAKSTAAKPAASKGAAAKSATTKAATAKTTTAAVKKGPAKKAAAAKPAAAKKAPAKKVAPKATAKKATPKAADKPSTPDDLKFIKGVGKMIETKLAKEGITSYAQIAAWTKADIEDFDERLSFKGRIARDEWVKQAKVLAKGGTTEFSERAAKGDVPSSS